MALETGSFISDLVSTNPTASDAKSQGDDHIRLLKSTVKATFPNVTGAVTATHTQLNTVPSLAPIASPTFTGVPAAPTATLGTSTTQIATTAFVAAASLAAAGVPDQSGNGGKFLTTDGSSASWGSPANGLVLLATLTPTAAANVDFLSTFTSTYDNYLILIDGVNPSADDILLMRFAVAGSSDGSAVYASAGNPTTGGTTASSSTSFNVANNVESSGVGASALINVCNANDAVKIKAAFGAYAATSSGGNYNLGGLWGGYVATNAISGFRLYWNGGANFTATGKVRVYGYANT